MTQKQFAVISPRDGFAGMLNDSEEVVTVVAPIAQEGRKLASGIFATRFPDTAIVEVADRNQAIEHLVEQQENSLALDFTLLLFDSNVKHHTRREVARELNNVLAKNERREYVLDILLVSPLPGVSDAEGAANASDGENRVQSLIEIVVDSQDRIRKAFSAWLAMRDDAMVRQAGVDKLYGTLVHCGVFRRLVEEGKTQADVDSLKAGIVMDQALKQYARIVLKLIASYSSSLPAGLRVVSQPRIEVRSNSISEHEENSVGQQGFHSRQSNSDLHRERAESQVEKIADLYRQGSDHTADQFLGELIESQLRSSSDESHLVKSLCNIAHRCVISGRRDISLACLDRALGFPKGLDSILYLQIGNHLRNLNQYDRALNCYEKAGQLDTGERSDSIRQEIIRVSVAKGDYPSALTAYLEIPDVDFQPQVLCDLGTLYRRMGDLFKARESYSKALVIDSSFHSARAGLAEANKQTGRHGKAIKKYIALLSDEPHLEESHLKIFTLALSFLFRLTHEFTKAEELLTKLNAEYPLDRDVHFQLAKLYMLMGETVQARSHFDLAKGPSLDTIAARLYRTAIGALSGQSASFVVQVDPAENVMPEDQGLLNCNRALTAIENQEYEIVRTVLENTHFVDRLHADFGAVLGFHANKKLDGRFDHKSDRVVCRIAKRGYKELQQSVHAILGGRFAEAKEMEHRMCLLIA